MVSPSPLPPVTVADPDTVASSGSVSSRPDSADTGTGGTAGLCAAAEADSVGGEEARPAGAGSTRRTVTTSAAATTAISATAAATRNHAVRRPRLGVGTAGQGAGSWPGGQPGGVGPSNRGGAHG